LGNLHGTIRVLQLILVQDNFFSRVSQKLEPYQEIADASILGPRVGDNGPPEQARNPPERFEARPTKGTGFRDHHGEGNAGSYCDHRVVGAVFAHLKPADGTCPNYYTPETRIVKEHIRSGSENNARNSLRLQVP
jgi:hypothetical protein